MANSRQRAAPADSTLAGVARTKRRMKSGIALKFAMPTSIVIVVMMAILGLSIRNSAAEALEASIQESGIFAATTAAAPDWHHEDNANRLSSMLGGSVEDVIIWETRPSGQQPAMVRVASKRIELAMNRGTPEFAKGTLVKVERGSMTSRAGETIPYRSFSHPIVTPGDHPRIIGSAEVILSEEQIERRLSGITKGIVILTLLGMVVGIAMSFFVASVITKPLHHLIHDVEVVAQGDLAHKTHVRSRDEVGLLAMTIDEMTRQLADKVRLQEDLSDKQHQEQIAREIQEKLFPSTMPTVAGATVTAIVEPAGDIAGDLFDCVDVGSGRCGLLVMSAGGRGIPAAIVLSMARSTFRAVAPGVLEPAEALRRINALFAPDLRRGMYVTAIYVIYDPTTSTAKIASAGHKLPLLAHSARKKSLTKIHPPGIAMGLDRGPVFDRGMVEATVVLEPGDALVLGSAGITQLKLESGEALGEARLFKAVHGALETGDAAAMQHVVDRIDAHLAAEPGDFDVLLVGLRRD